MAKSSTSFKPGQSGNPGGRARNVIRDRMRQKMTPEMIDALIDKFYAIALADPRYAHLFIENHDGKLSTPITGGTDDDGNEKPIPLRIVSE